MNGRVSVTRAFVRSPAVDWRDSNGRVPLPSPDLTSAVDGQVPLSYCVKRGLRSGIQVDFMFVFDY